MAHRFDQPGFVIGSELERSCARSQRKAAHIFADLRAHVDESFRSGWIGSGASRPPRAHSEFRLALPRVKTQLKKRSSKAPLWRTP